MERDLSRFSKALQSTTEMTADKADYIVFHLEEMVSDMRRLLAAIDRMDELSDDELADELYYMAVHTPNHMLAFAHLMCLTPTDVFGLGIQVDPECDESIRALIEPVIAPRSDERASE